MTEERPSDYEEVVGFWRKCGTLLIGETGDDSTPSPIATIGLIRESGDRNSILNGLRYVESHYRALLLQTEGLFDEDRYRTLLLAGFDHRYPGHKSHEIDTVLDSESLDNLLLVLREIKNELTDIDDAFWSKVLTVAETVAEEKRHEQ